MAHAQYIPQRYMKMPVNSVDKQGEIERTALGGWAFGQEAILSHLKRFTVLTDDAGVRNFIGRMPEYETPGASTPACYN